MEIIGEHHGELIEDNLKCLLKIKNGILGVYKHGETPFNKLNQPTYEKKWNFRKVNWKETKPVKVTKMTSTGAEWVWKYSHVIEYITDNNETQRIFINPNKWQRLILGWVNKKLLVRRITSIDYIIGLILAFTINIAAAYCYGWLTSKNNERNGVSPVNIQQNTSTTTNKTKNAGIIFNTNTPPTIIKSTI